MQVKSNKTTLMERYQNKTLKTKFITLIKKRSPPKKKDQLKSSTYIVHKSLRQQSVRVYQHLMVDSNWERTFISFIWMPITHKGTAKSRLIVQSFQCEENRELSSSSSLIDSLEFPNSFSPSVPVINCQRLVFQTASRVRTELMYVRGAFNTFRDLYRF